MEELNGDFWTSTPAFVGDETTGSALKSCIRHVNLQRLLGPLSSRLLEIPEHPSLSVLGIHQCHGLEFGKLVTIDLLENQLGSNWFHTSAVLGDRR
jgi:hypothetical protein